MGCHGKPMVIKENAQKLQFWGCWIYPSCTNTENYPVFCLYCGHQCKYRRNANSGCFMCPQVSNSESGEGRCRFKRAVEDINPVCPSCNDSRMELRVKRQDGSKFWGCQRYPQCRGSKKYEGKL